MRCPAQNIGGLANTWDYNTCFIDLTSGQYGTELNCPCYFTAAGLDDITVGRTFAIATLPNYNDDGTDRIFFVANGPGTVTMESMNFPTETFLVDAGQV